MSSLLWALPLVPMVVGALLALAGGLWPATDRLAGPVAMLVSSLVVGLAVLVAIGRPSARAPLLPGVDAELAVDELSAVLVVTVALVSLLVLAFSLGELRPGEPRARFLGLMLLFVGAMLMTVTATNLLLLLASWELMGAMSYALIAFWWREPPRVRAATTAFLVTRTADVGQYLAAGAALAGTGTMALASLSQASPGWRHLVAAGLIVSALGKSAQLPFAFWISRAMAGPSPVSALLHSATMVAAGGYLLLRVEPLLASVPWAGPTVAWAGALTALALGAVAVTQTDLKQLLAASTSAQIGFVVLGAGVGATAAGTSQLVAHAAVKSALFLAAGAWLSSRGTKTLRSLRGAARDHPVLGGAAVLAFLALAGVPPLSLWLTKEAVLTVTRESSSWLYVVGLGASVLSAGYAGLALAVVAARRRPAERVDPADLEEEPTGKVAPVATAAILLLAGAGAVLGVQVLPAVQQWYAGGLAGAVSFPTGPELTVSALLAVAVVVALLLLRGGAAGTRLSRVAVLHGWLGLETASSRLVLQPTLALARVLARADDDVLDRSVDRLALLTRRVADGASVRDERSVDGGVQALARGTQRLGRLARRPQTGQLHQYYAQAVVGLVFILLFVLIGR